MTRMQMTLEIMKQIIKADKLYYNEEDIKIAVAKAYTIVDEILEQGQ